MGQFNSIPASLAIAIRIKPLPVGSMTNYKLAVSVVGLMTTRYSPVMTFTSK
jgi:hypothetical protein